MVNESSIRSYPQSNAELRKSVRSFSVDVDRRVSAVGYPGGNSLSVVAKKLTAELPSDLARLYAIYRWITTYIEYDVDAYFSGDLRNAVGAVNTFRRGKAVCDGYSALLQEMGAVAGLRIEKVDGYAKGYGYAVGVMTGGSNHSWNAVNLDGRWYLLDSTWDAGSIDDSGHFSRKSGKWNYFLVDPAFFINSHFPENPAWQLLPKHVTHNTFLAMAPLVQVSPECQQQTQRSRHFSGISRGN
ncbi:MAG: transglutaminase domain-containing protein [Chlorobium sp.]